MKQALIDASIKIFHQYGMKAYFQGGIEENQLTSANQVNILLGFSGGIVGNIVIGFKKSTATKVISSMLGGLELNLQDNVALSAIGEIATLITGHAIAAYDSKNKIIFSPPTIVTGERIFLLISRIKSNKLSFKLDNDLYNISYCLEQ